VKNRRHDSFGRTYLEAPKWQKEVVKIHTIFGGKNPHPSVTMASLPACGDRAPQAGSGREPGRTDVSR
jgi:hydrogenase large subunit